MSKLKFKNPSPRYSQAEVEYKILQAKKDVLEQVFFRVVAASIIAVNDHYGYLRARETRVERLAECIAEQLEKFDTEPTEVEKETMDILKRAGLKMEIEKANNYDVQARE